MRIVFMGTSEFAVPHLTAIHQSRRHAVVLVVTQPDRPVGRGQKLTPPAIKSAALAFGLPLIQPERLNTPAVRQHIAQQAADVLVVVSFGKILRPQLLHIAPLGCLNVHASLLPRHRGASPIQAQILAGDSLVGVSIMQLDEGLDTGPVALSAQSPALPRETAGQLEERLARLGGPLLIDALDQFAKNQLRFLPQDEAQATHCGLIAKRDGYLDFNLTAIELDRRIRAYDPWPGCFADLVLESNRRRLQIEEAFPLTGELPRVAPGMIAEVTRELLKVGTGEGLLAIRRVKPAGKRSLTIGEFQNGTPLHVGMCLQFPEEKTN